MELWVTLAKEAPAQLDLTLFRLFDHVAAWKPVDDRNQNGAARRARIAFARYLNWVRSS